MKIKETWKRFWTLSRAHDGFTLVELIVVIAILAILGGVAVPAYSGYITRTNMAADQTLASDVANALQMHYYSTISDPSNGFTGATIVILNADGVVALDNFADTAMKEAYGLSYAQSNALKLKYDKWGNGTANAIKVINHFGANANHADADIADIYAGNVTPSFGSEVTELFDTVKDTAQLAAGQKTDDNAAVLMQTVAGITLSYSDPSNTTDSSAVQLANVWASTAKWDHETNGFGMSGNGDKTYLAATYAVVKARNTACASYLRTLNKYAATELDALANLGDTLAPVDVACLVNMGGNDERETEVMNEFAAIFTDENVLVSMISDVTYYLSGSNEARIDAKAYFAAMETVKEVDQNTADDEVYWDSMTEAIGIYGDLASQKVTLAELESRYAALQGQNVENAIVITMELNPLTNAVEVKISPNSANP